jgi:hypothetical protein
VEQAVKRPSQVSGEKSAIVTGENLVSGWTRHIKDDQVAAAMGIIRRFGLDCLYGESPLPRVKGGIRNDVANILN